MSDKPFAATQQRLRKAREDGDIPKAQELATVCSFIGVGFAVMFSIGGLIDAAGGCFIEAVALIKQQAHGTEVAISGLTRFVVNMAQIVAAALLVGGVVSCGVALFATRGALTPISVKLERIAPAAQLQQLFSFATVNAFVRATFSAVCAGALILPFIIAMVAASMGLRSPLLLAAQAWNEVAFVLALLACIGLVVAGFEVFVVLRRRSQKLRMNHDEIRREAKEQQGDPHLRGSRKRRHRALLRGGVAAARKATVIVTNPTHIAIALLYAPPEIAVPRVLARGVDAVATAIKAAAREAGVPCIEHVPLARRLFAECDEGDVVPLETYALIAPIIAAAMRTSKKDASQ